MEVGSKNFVLECTVLGSDEPGQGLGYIHSFRPNIHTSAPQEERVSGVGSHYSATAVEVGLMEDYEQVVMMCGSDNYPHSSVVD